MHRVVPILGRGSSRGSKRIGGSPSNTSEWVTRTDIPEALNPAGATWKTLLASEFDGAANSPPPLPWHTGTEWEAPHTVLGGHQQRFRTDGGVCLDEMAWQDGNSNLVLGCAWDAPNAITKMAYLVTGQDGPTPRASDLYFTPTAEGLWFECKLKVPAVFPDPVWVAFWLYDVDGPTGSTGYRPEIDIMEHKGEDVYRDRFMSNTHGPELIYESSIGEEGGYGIGWGGYFKPTVDFPGSAAPNDGNYHTYALFWSLTEQRFYYDGILVGYRPRVAGDVVHGASNPMDLRITIEAGTNVMGSTGTPAAAAARGEYSNANVLVDHIRVYQRKLTSGTTSVKPRDSTRASNMGLSFLGQDLLMETGEPTDPWDYFAPNKGGRHTNDTYNSDPTYDRRVSIVTLNHAPAGVSTPIKAFAVKRTNGKRGSLNFLSQYLPARYNKFMVSAWVYYDSNFASIINTAGGYTNLDGKTPFLIHGGDPRILSPNEPNTNISYAGATTAVEHMFGWEFGLNFVVRTTDLTKIEYVPYGHLIGFDTRLRADSYSNYYKIVGGVPSAANVIDRCYITLGQWHLFEFYVEVGNTRSSGKMYFWVDGVLSLRLEHMDLGGYVGSRGIYDGFTAANIASTTGALDAGYYSRIDGPLIVGNTQPWRIGGDAVREMDGGPTPDNKYIDRATSFVYVWNRRQYGAL